MVLAQFGWGKSREVRMKALQVEDNSLLGKTVQRSLQEAGWIFDLAIDGDEALTSGTLLSHPAFSGFMCG